VPKYSVTVGTLSTRRSFALQRANAETDEGLFLSREVAAPSFTEMLRRVRSRNVLRTRLYHEVERFRAKSWKTLFRGLLSARIGFDPEQGGYGARLMRLVDAILEQRVLEHGCRTREGDPNRDLIEQIAPRETSVLPKTRGLPLGDLFDGTV
jgi:hypothetical protein